MRIIQMFSTELKIFTLSRGNLIYQIPTYPTDLIGRIPAYFSYSEKDGFRRVCPSELWGCRDGGASYSNSSEQLQHTHQERTGFVYNQ
jgi:hypothetical protein